MLFHILSTNFDYLSVIVGLAEKNFPRYTLLGEVSNSNGNKNSKKKKTKEI